MKPPSSTSLRDFVEQTLWNTFGIGLAGVAAVILLVFMVSMPICTLGMPWTPLIATGAITPHDSSDLRLEVPREGFAIIGTRVVGNREIDGVLRDVLVRVPYRRIVIEADGHVSYGSLQPIFQVARAHRLPVVLISRPVSVLEQSESRLRSTAK